jgi:hypothetical protein
VQLQWKARGRAEVWKGRGRPHLTPDIWGSLAAGGCGPSARPASAAAPGGAQKKQGCVRVGAREGVGVRAGMRAGAQRTCVHVFWGRIKVALAGVGGKKEKRSLRTRLRPGPANRRRERRPPARAPRPRSAAAPSRPAAASTSPASARGCPPMLGGLLIVRFCPRAQSAGRFEPCGDRSLACPRVPVWGLGFTV